MPWALIAVAVVALGLLFGAAAFFGARLRLSRATRLFLFSLALAAPVGLGIAWAWASAVAPPPLSRAEQILAENYRGTYGGLTIYHTFGQGRSKYNPPDILEAGGFIRDVRYTQDGAQVESFWLHTLQGRRFKFLVRPEIVPINAALWNVERFQVYSRCRCMVALHFTQQPAGNVAIILFAVEQVELE